MFKPIPLPWKSSQMEGFISRKTIELHYDGYYQKLIDRLNELSLTYINLLNLSYIDMVKIYLENSELYELPCEILSHEKFFTELSNQNEKISGRLLNSINNQYESFDKFVNKFNEEAMKRREWVWFVYDKINRFFYIIGKDSAYHPAKDGFLEIFCLDVCEHSYILDYGLDKKSYINNFWNKLDWRKIDSMVSGIIYGY